MNIDWSKAPEDATYCLSGRDFFKLDGDGRVILFINGSTHNTLNHIGDFLSSSIVDRPKKQEAWNGDGLPPVGLDVLAKVDFKKAPPYTIINLTEIGIDVQNSMPSFQKVKVLYASEKYVILLSIGVECMAPRSCVEFEKIKTAEQLAEEEIQAIRDEIRWQKPQLGPCPVALLYNKGYRKQ